MPLDLIAPAHYHCGVVHPDAITGRMAAALHLVARRTENTLDRVGVYRQAGLRGLFPPPPDTPVPVVRTPRWRLGGWAGEDWSFTSLHRPLDAVHAEKTRRECPENATVWARRIAPVGRRARGKLLYIHGWLQPETRLEEMGLLWPLARHLDLEIVQMQPPYHGRRTPRHARFGGELFWTADMVRSMESVRQAVLDARTLLGRMLADEGDPRPVGVSGISLGGFFSLLLACVEPRLAFALPLIAHVELGAIIRDAPVLSRMRRELSAHGWSVDDLMTFIDECDWSALRPVLPLDRIQVHVADDDRFFDPEVSRRMLERWGQPETRWWSASHMSFIPQLPRVARDLQGFVDRVLPARER